MAETYLSLSLVIGSVNLSSANSKSWARFLAESTAASSSVFNAASEASIL